MRLGLRACGHGPWKGWWLLWWPESSQSKGVIQVSPTLAFVLFCLCADKLFYQLTWQKYELIINETSYLQYVENLEWCGCTLYENVLEFRLEHELEFFSFPQGAHVLYPGGWERAGKTPWRGDPNFWSFHLLWKKSPSGGINNSNIFVLSRLTCPFYQWVPLCPFTWDRFSVWELLCLCWCQ